MKAAWIAEAISTLEAEGYTVLKTTSYRRAQERQRLADRLRELAEEDAERARQWARESLADERYMRDRCTYLYGLAARKGADDAELAGFFDRLTWEQQQTASVAEATKRAAAMRRA